MKKMNVIIYGATGSIGDATLSVIRRNKSLFNLQGVTCNTKIKKIKKIASEFGVKKIGIGNNISYNKDYFKSNKVYLGINKFSEIVDEKTDIIVFAISGIKTLRLITKLCTFGKKIGLANKECIISLGSNLMKLAKKHSSEIFPLDSEHNSIFHLLKNTNDEFKSITITASGGPFLNLSKAQQQKIKLKDALVHPIWKMGNKITVDSATLMNKALEIIEAKYLFNLEINQINAIIHPQSVIHAIVNYSNGISTAILNVPDMRIPISTLFFRFNFNNAKIENIDLIKYKKLEFLNVDEIKFPSINLGYEVIKMGGLAPNCFNYINELLVNNFLRENIKYSDIIELNKINLENVFSKNKNVNNPNIDDVEYINEWIDKNLYLGKNK